MKNQATLSLRIVTLLGIFLTSFWSARAAFDDPLVPADPTIVGGQVVVPGAWPWHAAVMIDNWYNCGGSLIEQDWIVTAAHCVLDMDDQLIDRGRMQVRLGEFDLDHNDGTEQTFNVHQIIVHPAFDRPSLDHDIALIQLSSPATYDSWVRPIRPAPTNWPCLADKMAVATGWGALYSGGPSPSKLQQVSVPILTNSQCEAWYDEAVAPSDWITDNMICAGYQEGGKDACQGDSGGPLVVPGLGDQWLLVGITSWGNGCAGEMRPGVYTRLSRYDGWITDHTNLAPLNLQFEYLPFVVTINSVDEQGQVPNDVSQ